MKKNIVEIEIKNAKLCINKDMLDNMELVDALAEMDGDEDVVGVSKVVRMLLGTENRKKLYDALRTESGNVPVAEVGQALREIFTKLGEDGKN